MCAPSHSSSRALSALSLREAIELTRTNLSPPPLYFKSGSWRWPNGAQQHRHQQAGWHGRCDLAPPTQRCAKSESRVEGDEQHQAIGSGQSAISRPMATQPARQQRLAAKCAAAEDASPSPHADSSVPLPAAPPPPPPPPPPRATTRLGGQLARIHTHHSRQDAVSADSSGRRRLSSRSSDGPANSDPPGSGTLGDAAIRTWACSARHGPVCHLTAKTKDNQCALHGSNNGLCLADAQSNEAQVQAAGLEESPRHQGGGTQCGSKDLANGRTQDGRKTASTRETLEQRARAIATWPLAKLMLDDSANLAHPSSGRPSRGHFGDCEDIVSPHLGARLFVGHHRPGSGQGASPPGEPQHELTAANYNHRRPFAWPFEAPATGWLYNATGLQPINSGSSATLKGKFPPARAALNFHIPHSSRATR